MNDIRESISERFESLAGAAGLGRRRFVRNLGWAGAVLGATAGGGACGGINNLAPAITDTDILNFALNLEYLEAEFYTYATTGNGIAAAGVTTSGGGGPADGTGGLTTGGAQVDFSSNPVAEAVALQIASDEQDHVKLLLQALGSFAVAKPAINLNALGIGFASVAGFLTLARAFEDVGVSVYGGAATLISSSSNLQTAAQILGTEAEHSGNIRLMVVENGIAVSALDSLDVPPTATSYFTVNSNALAVIRTTRQVLDIVYGGTGASGGFFPAGMNGTITD